MIFESNNELILNYKNNILNAFNCIDLTVFNRIINRLLALRESKGTLFICGNGGSAANAMHMANDFLYGIEPNGRSLKAEALSANSSVLTCLSNDLGYDKIYEHQLKVKASAQDVLIVLSGSGNSKNVINAIVQAQLMEMDTIAIVGFDGGICKNISDETLHFNVDDMQVAEDMQLVLGHMIMKSLKQIIEQVS